LEFALTILGSASATPTLTRHPTAQVLEVGSWVALIDCGEGTQQRLLESRIRPQRITHIFISHLHGDHYFGLPGLLSTMHLQSRTTALHLFGPAGLGVILTEIFRYSCTTLSFPLHFHPVDTTLHAPIFDDARLTVHSLPMDHRVPCCGYLFREKAKLRHLLKDRLPLGLKPAQLVALKHGYDLLDPTTGAVLVRNNAVTSPPSHARAYAYCADTRYKESLIPLLVDVDLMYHEATFMHDRVTRAEQTGHSSAHQAALLARLAGVKRLLIGHFSARYPDLRPLLDEARAVFPNTQLATEGKQVSVVAHVLPAEV
jgi:ribonuclease Z